MWTLALSALTTLAPKLITAVQELWEKYGEKWLIYRKGAADQHRKDKISQQEMEAAQSARAMERVNEIQKDATDRRGEPADGSDLFGVRDAGKGRDWLKP